MVPNPDSSDKNESCIIQMAEMVEEYNEGKYQFRRGVNSCNLIGGVIPKATKTGDISKSMAPGAVLITGKSVVEFSVTVSLLYLTTIKVIGSIDGTFDTNLLPAVLIRYRRNGIAIQG